MHRKEYSIEYIDALPLIYAIHINGKSVPYRKYQKTRLAEKQELESKISRLGL